MEIEKIFRSFISSIGSGKALVAVATMFALLSASFASAEEAGEAEVEEIEEVVEQLKSDSLKDMFPTIEDLKNKIKKGTEKEIDEICAISGVEKTDSLRADLIKVWRNS